MTAPAHDHTEVEWQFRAPASAAVVEWLQAPGGAYTAGDAGTKRLEDTYFDTEDWRLYRAGFTARVRRTETGAELTMKVMAAAKDGLRSRRELNEPLAQELVARPWEAPGPCGERLRVLAGKRALRPLFTLLQERHAFVLSHDRGELAEVAVDETRVSRAGGGEQVLSRVEVELLDGGSLERALPFVEALVAACKLAPAEVAKFQAGLAASGLQPPQGYDFGATDIEPNMTAAEVAFAVMRRHFAAMLEREPGARLGEDPEAVHDMRVAGRRLRAALQTFREVLPPELQQFRAEIGWVARALGEVRDLDVQRARLAEWQSTPVPGGAEALEPLARLIEARRTAARQLALAVLDSKRYEELVRAFGEVLRVGPLAGFAGSRKPVLAVAPEIVRKRYKRLRKRAAAAKRDAAAEQFHRARIEAKKLRYALEFVGPLYGKRAETFIAKVTALQDVLGEHHDAVVAQQALAEFAQKHGGDLPPRTVLAMGAVAERHRVAAEKLQEEFAGVYGGVRGRPWRRLRKRMVARRRQGAPVQQRVLLGLDGRRWRVGRADEGAEARSKDAVVLDVVAPEAEDVGEAKPLLANEDGHGGEDGDAVGE